MQLRLRRRAIELIPENINSTETVEIMDDVRFRGEGVGAIANESVEVSDVFEAYLGGVLETSEDVLISDSANFGAGSVGIILGGGRGRTLQGGAQLGVTVQAGTKRGSSS